MKSLNNEAINGAQGAYKASCILILPGSKPLWSDNNTHTHTCMTALEGAMLVYDCPLARSTVHCQTQEEILTRVRRQWQL